jgi:hypothetical protein
LILIGGLLFSVEYQRDRPAIGPGGRGNTMGSMTNYANDVPPEEIAELREAIERLKAERDTYLSLAAYLFIEFTMTHDYREWTPHEAVEHAKRQAMIDVTEASNQQWSAKQITDLMNCRDVVKDTP